ncbi:hypothetical protein NW759_012917 [Fusarium solani]|nr:hypothetical protein NW759_012917 [Fusarium solani]
MATQNAEFVYDRAQNTDVFDQDFDHELSLRLQFVQAQAGKPLPIVLLPNLSRPPKHPNQAHDDELTETIYMIRDELKYLNETEKFDLNYGYPPNFSSHHQVAPGAVLGPKTQADHVSIAASEIQELTRLITEDRYRWFLDCERQTRDGIKPAETRISELEVGMTRQYNVVSKEFEIWAENIGDNAFLISDPFRKIPDVDTDCGWHAWFRLEKQLLMAKRLLEIERRAQHWLFCDILAAMTNGLIEKGEMH